MRAIIIDGGKATRLGYPPPKGLVPVGDTYLMEYLFCRLKVLGTDRATVILGFGAVTRFAKSLLGEQVDVVVDYKMEGPLAALCQVAGEFRNSDVVITFGDAYFERLGQLLSCEEGTVLALTDRPQKGRPQIRMKNKKIDYAGRFLKEGAVTYAGILRVNRCPKFWDAIAMGRDAGMKWISRPLCFLPKGMVKLKPVLGLSVNVNTPKDLELVRGAV